ncbi:hypothetical protein [Leucobacter sp. GX24907]
MAGGVGTVIRRACIALLIIVLLLAAGLAWWNKQVIADHFQATGFEPAEEIEEVLDTLSLTGAGERVFLATHPTIEASQHFNEQCAQVDHTDEGHVLGCYSGGKIHLFGVEDQRLDGIVEVTAAHELLHAGYARLRDSEREQLGEQLQDAFDTLSEDDAALRERMAVYEHLPESSFVNELHSVLGTEVRDLPPELEAHYAEWFNDRAAILDLFDDYHSVFVDLQQEADDLNAELARMRTEYEERSHAYDLAVRQYNADSESLSQRNDAYEFANNPEEFYRLRDELGARRGELESELQSLDALAEQYEEYRSRLKELSETSIELDQHLNSDLAPPATSPS